MSEEDKVFYRFQEARMGLRSALETFKKAVDESMRDLEDELNEAMNEVEGYEGFITA